MRLAKGALCSGISIVFPGLILLFLSGSIPGVGSNTASSPEPQNFEWQVLTKRNFSSETRRLPFILLMVTLPWYGESRSLMVDIRHSISSRRQDFSNVRLMVIHRNSEKLICDVLGATEGINIIFYHHSIPYKYSGKLKGRNIISSLYYTMSLKPEEIPLKHLHTTDDVEEFLKSTDKSIILLEFCGLSKKLLHKNIRAEFENTSSQNSFSDNGCNRETVRMESENSVNLLNVVNKIIVDELNNDLEPRFTRTPWGAMPANQSIPEQARQIDDAIFCTVEEIRQLETFYSRLISIARDHFLPPERQKFGFLSDRSLLPKLHAGNIETWSLMIHYSGFPNCSLMVKEEGDLKAILQRREIFIEELDVDGQDSIGAAFPANSPSLVLFIDRSSDSSLLREESEQALEALRAYACHNQMVANPCASVSFDYGLTARKDKAVSYVERHSYRVDSLVHRSVKVNDMSIMILNEGRSTGDAAGDTHDNHLYNKLMELLRQTKLPHKAKGKRISLVAKEAGFQLMSDDFNVQSVDSDPAHNLLSGDTGNVDADPENGLNIDMDSISITGIKTKVDSEERDWEKKIASEKFAGNIVTDDMDLTYATDERKASHYLDADNGIDQIHDGLPQYESTSELRDAFNEEKKYLKEDLSKIDEVSFENTDSAFSSSVMTRDNKEYNTSGTQSMSTSIHDNGRIIMRYFFSDGEYQALKTLTGGSKMPHIVIVDPIKRKHYVFEEADINYSSISNFIDKFMNNSLPPYQHSGSSVVNSKEFPRPPFVNSDFHEASSIPRADANTFCHTILGYDSCTDEVLLSNFGNFTSAWKTDVLVLFSNSWCGFCQRMELVVREVYRAFRRIIFLSSSDDMIMNFVKINDFNEKFSSHGLPSIYLMDCNRNDCAPYLGSPDRVVQYPTLLLFPAENKSAIYYEGDISVIRIFEFLQHHGRNSDFLSKHKEFLWTEKIPVPDDTSFSDQHLEMSMLDTAPKNKKGGDSGTQLEKNKEGNSAVVGSILTATDNLANSAPFDNSTILIVTADSQEGFQGVIINKHLRWDIFKDPENELEPLKHIPLSYGGPVRHLNFPFVSLSRNSMEGYKEFSAGVHFGDAVATSKVVQRIKSGDLPADGLWLFLGYSGWGHQQLLDELAEGAWHLSEFPIKQLDWPQI